MGQTCGMYGEKKNAYCVVLEKTFKSGHLQDLGINGKIVLKWIINN